MAMSMIVVAYAVVAAGILLLRVTGQRELPGYLDVVIDVWDRIATTRRPGREPRKRQKAIEGALSRSEFTAADAGDVVAADLIRPGCTRHPNDPAFVSHGRGLMGAALLGTPARVASWAASQRFCKKVRRVLGTPSREEHRRVA